MYGKSQEESELLSLSGNHRDRESFPFKSLSIMGSVKIRTHVRKTAHSAGARTLPMTKAQDVPTRVVRRRSKPAPGSLRHTLILHSNLRLHVPPCKWMPIHLELLRISVTRVEGHNKYSAGYRSSIRNSNIHDGRLVPCPSILTCGSDDRWEQDAALARMVCATVMLLEKSTNGSDYICKL